MNTEAKSDLTKAQRGVVGAVIGIIILTLLELPPPIGFETRPQDNVSLFWLVFFLVIVVTELATIPLIYLRPLLGAKLGMLAAALNILQVIADQAHLLQPEAAPLGYSLLEGTVVIASLFLIYYALQVKKN